MLCFGLKILNGILSSEIKVLMSLVSKNTTVSNYLYVYVINLSRKLKLMKCSELKNISIHCRKILYKNRGTKLPLAVQAFLIYNNFLKMVLIISLN